MEKRCHPGSERSIFSGFPRCGWPRRGFLSLTWGLGSRFEDRRKTRGKPRPQASCAEHGVEANAEEWMGGRGPWVELDDFRD